MRFELNANRLSLQSILKVSKGLFLNDNLVLFASANWLKFDGWSRHEVHVTGRELSPVEPENYKLKVFTKANTKSNHRSLRA